MGEMREMFTQMLKNGQESTQNLQQMLIGLFDKVLASKTDQKDNYGSDSLNTKLKAQKQKVIALEKKILE